MDVYTFEEGFIFTIFLQAADVAVVTWPLPQTARFLQLPEEQREVQLAKLAKSLHFLS